MISHLTNEWRSEVKTETFSDHQVFAVAAKSRKLNNKTILRSYPDVLYVGAARHHMPQVTKRLTSPTNSLFGCSANLLKKNHNMKLGCVYVVL